MKLGPEKFIWLGPSLHADMRSGPNSIRVARRAEPRRRDKIVVVIRERRRQEAGRDAAGHNCSAALSSAESSSGTSPDAAPLLRREARAHGRARLRLWRSRCRRRRRSGRRSGRPVRPSSSSSPARKALSVLHSLRAVPEAAAWPRQARVRLCIYRFILDLCVHGHGGIIWTI